MSTKTFQLPNWKKPSSLNSKGCISEAKDTLNSMIMEAPENDVKEFLLKIKIDATYDVNHKVMISQDVKILQDTLKYLDVEYQGLTKEGAVLKILHRLHTSEK